MSAETLPRRALRTPPFENGDRMDQPAFHRAYLRTPESVKAELLGGVVYMASPVRIEHSDPDGIVSLWLGMYCARTPGTRHRPNSTVILGRKDEPQPDQLLLALPECGGRTKVQNGCVSGPPEFVAEIANSTRAQDLHLKRRRYFQAGIPEYLVVLPRRREVRWFVRGAEDYELLLPDADGYHKSRIFGGLWLDAAALGREDRAGVLAALDAGLASPDHAAAVAQLAAKNA